MAPSRAAFLIAACGLAVLAVGLGVEAGKDPSVRPFKGRRLDATADPDGDVCYEGCFAAPIGGSANPLPLFLTSSGEEPLALADCFTAAVAAGAMYFAIVNTTECYGGDSPLVGWAPDSCPLDCVPDGNGTFACGDTDKASLFSMGLCRYLDVPCAPEDASPPPPSPLAPPSQPAAPGLIASPPPPRAPAVPAQNAYSPPDDVPEDYSPPPPREVSPPPSGPRQYTCKSGVALWGKPLAGSPIKLNPKRSSKDNTATCQNQCSSRTGCRGFYYKTTGWCYLMSAIYSFSKEYSTAVQACKIVS